MSDDRRKDIENIYKKQEYGSVFDIDKVGTISNEESSPCYNCSGNPKNNPHANGVCYCTLGTPDIIY